MTKPLRLRLRVFKEMPAQKNSIWYLGVAKRHSRFPSPAVLEFENPLNGSWHAVEVVNDETSNG